MKYRLEAYNIWQLGQRSNQEDSIFPEYGKVSATDRLFILCDGMGGHSSGEVASQTVCSAMSESVFRHSPDAEGPFTAADFETVLSETYNVLDTKDDGAGKKMGTTLTFLKFHAGGTLIAHIGDSRVYHIRPGKTAEETRILFQTEDHSLVNDLIKVGELTPEEAKYSTQKNVITRAMQPNMERRSKADIHNIEDIRPGDYFMMCSDGILEQLEDENIEYIFSDKAGNAKKKVEMLEKVTEHNRDNHSAILVYVTEVLPSVAELKQISAASPEKVERAAATTAAGKAEAKAPRRHALSVTNLLLILSVILLAISGYIIYRHNSGKGLPKIEIGRQMQIK